MGDLAQVEPARGDRELSVITVRIRRAIAAIEETHPALGRHLSRSIQTGLICGCSSETETIWAPL